MPESNIGKVNKPCEMEMPAKDTFINPLDAL